MAAIVQSSEDAIIGKDLSGIITSWNPAAEKFFGYSEKEAIGKPISILGAPGRLDEFKEIIETVKKGLKVERYETQRRRKDGTLVDVSVTAPFPTAIIPMLRLCGISTAGRLPPKRGRN